MIVRNRGIGTALFLLSQYLGGSKQWSIVTVNRGYLLNSDRELFNMESFSQDLNKGDAAKKTSGVERN